jgi:hypothetical protein
VGKGFDIGKLDPVVQRGLETAPQDAQKLMAWKVPTLARVANGGSLNTDTMGVYGNYYLKRTIVAQLGLGANLVEDAIYPLNMATKPASRSMAQTNTPSLLRRVQRLLSTPSGRSLFMMRKDFKWETA